MTYLSGDRAAQPTSRENLTRKNVLLLLARGFEDAEAVAAIDVFGWTEYRPSIATVGVTTCGLHETVTGGFGITIKPELLLGEVDAGHFDALVIPGGFHNRGYGEVYCEEVYALIRKFRSVDKPVATMCVGILPVAEAGALQGGKATTYAFSSRHDNYGVLEQNGCEGIYKGVVDWNGVISCSGPEFSDQVLVKLLEKIVGKAAAAEVSHYRRGCE